MTVLRCDLDQRRWSLKEVLVVVVATDETLTVGESFSRGKKIVSAIIEEDALSVIQPVFSGVLTVDSDRLCYIYQIKHATKSQERISAKK